MGAGAAFIEDRECRSRSGGCRVADITDRTSFNGPSHRSPTSLCVGVHAGDLWDLNGEVGAW